MPWCYDLKISQDTGRRWRKPFHCSVRHRTDSEVGIRFYWRTHSRAQNTPEWRKRQTAMRGEKVCAPWRTQNASGSIRTLVSWVTWVFSSGKNRPFAQIIAVQLTSIISKPKNKNAYTLPRVLYPVQNINEIQFNNLPIRGCRQQKVCLTVTENKVQLIELICQHLISITQEQPLDRKLVITGKDPTPIEVLHGAQRELSDFRTTHEEADVIIVQQGAKLANAGTPSIRVICDDTDVFVLLIYFYHSLGLTCTLTMESTGCERALIDIGASVEKHKDISPYLPGAHALTGCDTVAQCFMIGKATALKTLRAGIHLPSLGNIEAHIDDIVNECTAFKARCYGSYRTDSMSDVRVEVWAVKAARRKATAAPQLKMLPPTTAAFQLNARRAHIQTAIWMSCLEADPAPLDPVLHGWRADNLAKSLVPLMLPPTTPLAPMELLEMIHCRCASDKPCFKAQCRCNAAKLPCTVFCACYEKSNCRNEKTITASEADAEVINMWWCILPR